MRRVSPNPRHHPGTILSIELENPKPARKSLSTLLKPGSQHRQRCEPLTDRMGLSGHAQPRFIRRLIASGALMSLLQSPAAIALPAIETLDLTLRGEAKGWLNATCTYVGLGWLDKQQGRQALTRLMQLISAHHLGQAEVIKAKEAALQRDPSCRAIWPDTPSHPIKDE